MATGRFLWAGMLALILSFPSFAHAEGKALKVGVFEIPPISFSTDDGKYDGLAITMLEKIALEEGYSIKYVPCEFSHCLELLESGQIDIQSVIAYSDERTARLDFSEETLFNDWGVVYIRPGLHIESVLGLNGLRIAMMRKSIQIAPFKKLLKSFNVQADIIETEEYVKVFELVEKGEADALVVNRLFALRNDSKYNVIKTPIIFSPIDIRVAATKGEHGDFLSSFDKGMRAYKNDKESIYYQSIERLFGFERGERLPSWLLGVLAIVAVVALTSLLFVQILRLQVKKRTAELKRELEERKRIEQVVFQGQRDWVETFDTITDIITIHDRDFNIIRANKAASEALDLPWSRINKAKCFEHYHGTDCPPEECLSCQSLVTGEPSLVEFYEPHLGKYMELRAIPRKNKEGQIVGLIHVARDITDKKKTEEDLKMSERKYRNIVDNSPAGIAIADLQGRLLFANKSLFTISGYESADDFHKINIANVYENPADRRHFVDELRNKGRIESFETILKTKDGVVMNVLMNAVLEGGEITSMLIDVSELKRAERDLRQSEEKYRRLFEESDDAIFLLDKNRGYVDCNEKAVRMFNASGKNDLLNRHIPEISPEMQPDGECSVEKAGEMIAMALESGANHFEWYHQRLGGETFPADVSLTAIPFENTTLLHSVIRDVTDKKKADEELRNSEEKFSKIFLSSPDAITISRLSDGVLVDFNEVFEMRSGYAREDAIGKTTKELNLWVDPEDMDNFAQVLKKEGRVRDLEVSILNKSGQRGADLLSAEVIELHGEPHIIAIARNIDERKRAEQSAHLASIGELAAGVAHEINNPTSSIMLNSRLLMKSEAIQEGEAREIYKRIYEDTERISDIVKSLLSFARPDSGTRKRTAVRSLVGDSLRLTRKHLEKNNIRIEVREEDDIPEVMVSPQRIEQVIINIITNAIYALNKKYPQGNENKRIELTVRHISASKGCFVRMEFMDLGCGIPLGMLDRIKNPFFTTKPATEGTGLGLSISHGIIADHGGEIEIDSREGEFTKVRVDLPVEESA